MSTESVSQSSSGANTYVMVPMFIFFVLLIFSVIRSPSLISSAGIGSVIIVVAPLILATYALTIIVMAGRAGVDLSIGPLLGFINVGMIQLFAAGALESPLSFFLFAMVVGVLYQVLMGLIIVFIRVQPIIVSLSGYLALVGLNLVIMPRPSGIVPEWLRPWGAGTELISPILIILVVATAAWYVLAKTAFFGHLRLMGADERAAYTSGVRINLVRIAAHAIAGIYAGLAAITFTALISSGDPSQGTTYTLMAVTALVLGGANLAGGRGGAFSSLLGALNIYLITYVLATFSFGGVQSFVTDLAYGVMLVASLLISVALPQIQKVVRNLSPTVFFVILSVITLGVIMHMTMDNLEITEQASESFTSISSMSPDIAEEDVAAVGYSAGTYIFFIVIGFAAIAYLFVKLFTNINQPMIGLTIIVIATGFGLIFYDGENIPSSISNANVSNSTVLKTNVNDSPTFFVLEEYFNEAENEIESSLIVKTTRSIVLVAGAILLTSLIVLVMLPSVSARTKKVSMWWFVIGLITTCIALLFYSGSNSNGEHSNYYGVEIYTVAFIGIILFIFAAPLVHTKLKDISHVVIIAICVLVVASMYLFSGPSFVTDKSINNEKIEYASPIIVKSEPKNTKQAEYAKPERVNVGSKGLNMYTQVAFISFLIVFLHLILWKTMRDNSFSSFWPYAYVVAFSILAWGTIFYATGVPIWKIVLVVIVGMLTAPIVLHILDIIMKRENRDMALRQWTG